ncbi:hypothetical protein A3D71_00700 [Candidatus Kaiserbacteria bacterium RIFCSPHIGHO2_02_FULL_55_20]|uniref:NGG1p interacting factor NIF3 n=1 Tax=Candidatus Kaiserbacteria bacterium RIFCSPHIGHO2_02_FULL_55_20 TaxID=1798497 RepID=A0A1F6DWR8_9BACT|nr:MAG: hypothetical protein A2680_00730 [Candidatus Kaiserbacteria bacterium RIFCSPHIGHO2_01_FULL_55_37]OGG65874.1 MAG: hypothetical protein A3D71_00700 [Candidatus Kaiserbacteria bacterium RIFCSPHIGHO2_02_FULL_55_20]
MAKMYKLVFTVPLSHGDAVREAIGKAGAGRYGNYSFASFSSRGVGRFKPESGAHPHTGEIGKLTEVEEERVECRVSPELVDDVIAALKRTHPYEVIAYDLYPLEVREP